MTDEVSTIGVRLTLDASGFTAPLKSATGALNAFQQQAARAATGVAQTRAGGGGKATPGTAVGGVGVPVDLTINAASLAKLRSEITKGLGAIPVTIAPQFATTGRWSVQNMMGSVLARQYGLTPQQGRVAANRAIESAVGSLPHKAVGGPVLPYRPIVVGETRPEVFVPKTAGLIDPSVKTFYKRQAEAQARAVAEARSAALREARVSDAWGPERHMFEEELQFFRDRNAMRGRRVRGYGGKYGAARPGTVKSWYEQTERLWGAPAQGERGWLYHATDQLPEIRGRFPALGKPGVQPIGGQSWWSRIPLRHFGPSLLRTPEYSSYMGGTYDTFSEPVPRSRLQYWGEDNDWHRFRRGRARQRGGRVFSGERINPWTPISKTPGLPAREQREMGDLHRWITQQADRPAWMKYADSRYYPEYRTTQHFPEMQRRLERLSEFGRVRGYPATPPGYTPDPSQHILRSMYGLYRVPRPYHPEQRVPGMIGSGISVGPTSFMDRMDEVLKVNEGYEQRRRLGQLGATENDWGIFHATTQMESVLKQGLLSGDELLEKSSGFGNSGLGGRTNYVSTAFSLRRARQLASIMRFASGVARGDKNLEDVLRFYRPRYTDEEWATRNPLGVVQGPGDLGDRARALLKARLAPQRQVMADLSLPSHATGLWWMGEPSASLGGGMPFRDEFLYGKFSRLVPPKTSELDATWEIFKNIDAVASGGGNFMRSGAFFMGTEREAMAKVNPRNIGVVQLAMRQPNRRDIARWGKSGSSHGEEWIEQGIKPSEYEMRIPSELLTVIGRRALGGEALEAKAIKMFGVTHDIREAGYLTPSGKYLDFSGRSEAGGYHREGDRFVPDQGRDYLAGSRAIDHRQAWQLWPRRARKYDSEPISWMTDEGFIRIHGGPDLSIMAEMSRPVTGAQYSRLVGEARYAPNFYLDISKPGGGRLATYESEWPIEPSPVPKMAAFLRSANEFLGRSGRQRGGGVEASLTRRQRSYTANIRHAAAALRPEHLELGSTWYTRAQSWISATAAKWGVPESIVRGMLASQSASTEWSANKTKVERMLAAMISGRASPYGREFNPHAKAEDIFRAYQTDPNFDPWSVLGHTPKTGPFYLNLGGNLDALTIDRWALRTATLGQISQAGVGPLRRGVESAFRRVAREHDLAPAQFQAALWLREKELAALAKGRTPDLSKMQAGGPAFYAGPGRGVPLFAPYRPQPHIKAAIDAIRNKGWEHSLSVTPEGTSDAAWSYELGRARSHVMTEEQVRAAAEQRYNFEIPEGRRIRTEALKNRAFMFYQDFLPPFLREGWSPPFGRGVDVLEDITIGDEGEVGGEHVGPIGIHNHPLTRGNEEGGQRSPDEIFQIARPSTSDIRSMLMTGERESWVVTPGSTAIMRRTPETQWGVNDTSSILRRALRLAGYPVKRGEDTASFMSDWKVQADNAVFDRYYAGLAKKLKIEYLRFPTDLTQIPRNFPVGRLPFEVGGSQTGMFRARGGDVSGQPRLARDFVLPQFGSAENVYEWGHGDPREGMRYLFDEYLPYTGSRELSQDAFWAFMSRHGALPTMSQMRQQMGRGETFGRIIPAIPWVQDERTARMVAKWMSLQRLMPKIRQNALGGLVQPAGGFVPSVFQTAANWASDPFMAIMAWQSQQQRKQRARGGRVEMVNSVIAELQRRYPKVPLTGIQTERSPYSSYAARYLPHYRDFAPAGVSLTAEGAISLNLAKHWGPQYVHPRGIQGSPLEAIATHEFGHALAEPLGFKARRILARAIERDAGKGTIVQRGYSDRYINDLSGPHAPMVSDYAEKNITEAFADYFLASERQREEYKTPGVRAFGRALARLGPLFRASGGKASEGLYIVGEIGEELFVPNRLAHLIPKGVMDQIPKAAGGMQVIGRKRNELFAPPEDGIIVPHRLMNQIPHAQEGVRNAAGRFVAGNPGPIVIHNATIQNQGQLNAQGAQVSLPPTATEAWQRANPMPAGAFRVPTGTGRFLEAPETSRTKLMQTMAGLTPEQIESGVAGLYKSRLVGPSPQEVKAADQTRAQAQRAAAQAQLRAAQSNISLELGQMAGGVTAWQQVMSGRTPRGLIAQLSSIGLGGRGEQFALQHQFRTQMREFNAAIADPKVKIAMDDYVEKSAKVMGARGNEQKALKDELNVIRRSPDDIGKAARKFEELRQTAVKLQPTTGNIVRNLGVVIGATSLYGIAMQGASVGLEAAMQVTGRWVDQMMGFRLTATRVTSALADQARQQGGNVEAAIASKAATAGMTASVASWVEQAAGSAVTAKAAAKSYAEASELFRAAIGATGKAEGLYGGYGGILGTALLGTEMGGGKGLAEQALLDIAAARGQGGFDVGRYLAAGAAGAATGAGVGALSFTPFGIGAGAIGGGIAGGAGALISDILSGNIGTAGGPLAGQPGEAETAIVTNLTAAMQRSQQRSGGPTMGFAYRGQQALDTLMRSPDWEKLPNEVKNFAKAGYAMTDEFGKILTTFRDIDTGWKQIAEGTTITDVATWSKTVEREISAKFQSIDIAGGVTRAVTIPLQMALQRIASPLAAPGAGVVPGAGLTAEQAAQIGVTPGLTGQAFFGGATTAGGMGLSPVLAKFASGLVGDAAKMQEEFRLADKAARERAVAMIREQAQAIPPATPPPAPGPATSPNPYMHNIGGGSPMTVIPGATMGPNGWVFSMPPGGTPAPSAPSIQQRFVGQTAPQVPQLAAGEAMVQQYNTAMDAAAGASAELKGLNDQIASLNAVAAQASWANTTRLALRSIADAEGMLGQKGGSELGRIERSLYKIGRASQALDLQLNQYSINFQTALAGFQAPGLTSEERAARQQQAQLEASFAQKKQNYAVESFDLAGREWLIQARRNLQDAQAAWNAARAGHAAEVVTAAAQGKIATLTQKIQTNLSLAESIYSDSSSKYEASLALASQAAANFGGSVGAQVARLSDFGSVVGVSAAGVEKFLESLGFTYRRNYRGDIIGVTPPSVGTAQEFVSPIGGRAAGYLGTFARGAMFTVGEAGPETVAILRNPRTHMLDTGGWSGGAPAAPTTVYLYLTVQGDVKDEATVGKIVRAVEDSFNRKAARLGMRSFASNF